MDANPRARPQQIRFRSEQYIAFTDNPNVKRRQLALIGGVHQGPTFTCNAVGVCNLWR